MRYPFEASPDELAARPDDFVDAVFATLESEFLVLPRGEGFVDYPSFQRAYEILKEATGGFTRLEPEQVLMAVEETPLVLVVLRTILGFTPSEWAYMTSRRLVQHLAGLSKARLQSGQRGFEVIACIAGRGFGERREDMKKLLLATDGKVFTLKTLDRLVTCSGLRRLNRLCPLLGFCPSGEPHTLCSTEAGRDVPQPGIRQRRLGRAGKRRLRRGVSQVRRGEVPG